MNADSKFWQQQPYSSNKPAFKNSADLWQAACAYFDWVDENPLYEFKSYSYQGSIIIDKLPRMRAMTITGMCVYLNISSPTWYKYKKKKGFAEVCIRIEDIIKTQKFTGAAAGLLNPAIIARELGMADKHDTLPDTVPSPDISVTIYEGSAPVICNNEDDVQRNSGI